MCEFRLSSFTIIVELENTNNEFMLVHGYTGAIDIINVDIVSYIQTNEVLKPNESPFSNDTFDKLVARGYITDKSKEYEYTYVKRMAEALHRQFKLFKNFMFVIAYDCNFRCPYCIEQNVSKKGRQWSKKVFSKEMVDRAYEAMIEIEPNKELHSKIITLYGGEPLLAQNRNIVEYIVNKGKAEGYKFSAVTNGYDLEHYLDLMGEDKIFRIQISIDGLKNWHDQRRVHFKNGKSFDKIIENIGKALSHNIYVSIRINTDNNNFDSLVELSQLFNDLGYTKNENFKVYSARLYDADDDADDQVIVSDQKKPIRFLTPKEFNEKHQKERITGMVCNDEGIFLRLSNAIKEKRSITFAAAHCGVQGGSYIFDPYGDIYSCWEKIGELDNIQGSYAEKLQLDKQQIQAWRNRNVGNATKCSECKYALICGGGCVAKFIKIKDGNKLSNCRQYPEVFRVSANRVYDTYIKSKHIE